MTVLAKLWLKNPSLYVVVNDILREIKACSKLKCCLWPMITSDILNNYRSWKVKRTSSYASGIRLIASTELGENSLKNPFVKRINLQNT